MAVGQARSPPHPARLPPSRGSGVGRRVGVLFRARPRAGPHGAARRRRRRHSCHGQGHHGRRAGRWEPLCEADGQASPPGGVAAPASNGPLRRAPRATRAEVLVEAPSVRVRPRSRAGPGPRAGAQPRRARPAGWQRSANQFTARREPSDAQGEARWNWFAAAAPGRRHPVPASSAPLRRLAAARRRGGPGPAPTAPPADDDGAPDSTRSRGGGVSPRPREGQGRRRGERSRASREFGARRRCRTSRPRARKPSRQDRLTRTGSAPPYPFSHP